MKRKNISDIIKTVCTTIALLMCAGCLTYTVFAWFAFNRVGRTDDMEVDIPPVIYIKDDNLSEMVSFNLDGLQINKPYSSVFCVAPAFKNAADYFDLGVIYTENIGMIIDIYPVSGISESAKSDEFVYKDFKRDGNTFPCYFNYSTTETAWQPAKVTYGDWKNTDPTKNEGDLNRGVYKLYKGLTFSAEGAESSDIYEELNDESKYRFFVLCVTWKTQITESELEKEADVVYIVSKGTSKEDSGEKQN